MRWPFIGEISYCFQNWLTRSSGRFGWQSHFYGDKLSSDSKQTVQVAPGQASPGNAPASPTIGPDLRGRVVEQDRQSIDEAAILASFAESLSQAKPSDIHEVSNSHPPPRPVQTTATSGGKPSTPTFEILAQYFHLPEKETAKELGICLTSLKKVCRQLGITRWPYRKLRSLEKSLSSTPRAAAAMACGVQGDDIVKGGFSSLAAAATKVAAESGGSGSGISAMDALKQLAAGGNVKALMGSPVAAQTTPASGSQGSQLRKRYLLAPAGKSVMLSDEERAIIEAALGPQIGAALTPLEDCQIPLSGRQSMVQSGERRVADSTSTGVNTDLSFPASQSVVSSSFVPSHVSSAGQTPANSPLLHSDSGPSWISPSKQSQAQENAPSLSSTSFGCQQKSSSQSSSHSKPSLVSFHGCPPWDSWDASVKRLVEDLGGMSLITNSVLDDVSEDGRESGSDSNGDRSVTTLLFENSDWAMEASRLVLAAGKLSGWSTSDAYTTLHPLNFTPRASVLAIKSACSSSLSFETAAVPPSKEVAAECAAEGRPVTPSKRSRWR